MTGFPLPFTCLQEPYAAGVSDEHGNTVPSWGTPVDVPCFWWFGASSEPSAAPTGTDQAAADLTVVVDVNVVVDHRDRFTVGGLRFEVVGLPKEWDHGPFGFTPNRQVIELKWIG